MLNADGQSIGVVGQGGQMFVRGAEEGGTLQVRWGDGEAKQCKVSYELPAREGGAKSAALTTIEARCQ